MQFNRTERSPSPLYLNAGTYYLSVQGTGSRSLTLSRHFSWSDRRPTGAPDNPQLQDDSDWGYSNYGSLGYYSIKGTIGKDLVVGVDFDATGGASPKNWNQYTGGGLLSFQASSTKPALTSRTRLSISSSGNSITTSPSTNPIDPVDIPAHGIPLERTRRLYQHLDRYAHFHVGKSRSRDRVPSLRVWSFLGSVREQHYRYRRRVERHPADLLVQAIHFSRWDGCKQQRPGSGDLSTFALYVISDTNGNITITVTGADGQPAGIAGLAINTTKVGSLAGTKFNDANGNQTEDSVSKGWPVGSSISTKTTTGS